MDNHGLGPLCQHSPNIALLGVLVKKGKVLDRKRNAPPANDPVKPWASVGKQPQNVIASVIKVKNLEDGTLKLDIKCYHLTMHKEAISRWLAGRVFKHKRR